MAYTALPQPTGATHVVNLGRLALLQPLIDKLNIAAIIDRHIPCEAEYSHGTVLAALLAARLHSPTALVNVADWAEAHGVEYLWNIPADKLNDDRLARALDAFFEHRHDIMADITHQVLQLTRLSLERLHFDTTHLVLYGSYDASQPRPESPLDRLVANLRASPAHITRGYLTRYKMLQLGLVSVADDKGAVPVSAHLFDGNRNGHTGIKEHYQLLRKYLALPDNLLLVSDRGTCSAEHLGTLLEHDHHALCAGQWQDYSSLYDAHADRLQWQTATYHSREQERRRKVKSSLPLTEYRLAVVDHELTHPKTKKPFKCRVIFVHSSAAAKESQERRTKNIATIRAGFDTLAAKLRSAHPATTPESVSRAIARLLGKKGAATLFRWQLVPLTETEVAALPPPAKGYRRQSHRLEYSLDEAAAATDTRHDGLHALVTTAPLTWSGDDLFTEYKRQIYVERENHELKTPIAVTPIFLKRPERADALISLLFVALQANMTLERLYRQTVSNDAPEDEKRMTAERLLNSFRVCGVCVEQESYGELVRAGQLTPEQKRILNQLSFPSPLKTLRTNLPPPPK